MSGDRDDGAPGEKVIRLFPGREGDVRDGLEHRPAFDWQDTAALEREIQGVLGEARPTEASAAETRSGPDARHRNAVRCPQCDRYTWRRTRYCHHCQADLPALAAERRRSWMWSVAIISWGLGLLCLYALQHQALPPKIRTLLMTAVLVIAGMNALGFWVGAGPGKERH